AACARIDVAQWWRLRLGRWWVGVGSGWVDNYTGNADAAQLWIDMHTAEPSKRVYLPQAHARKMSTQWAGIGRSFPLRLGTVRGSLDLGVRRLSANSYSELAVAGSVSREDFSGAVTRMQADRPEGRSFGRGWCIDAGAELESSHWRAQVKAEGLWGRMSWNALAVDAGYLSSPRVFTDSEGFLRDAAGGFSGVSSRRNLSGPVDPLVRLYLARKCRRSPFLSAAVRRGEKPTAGIGLQWHSLNGRAGYFCWYPGTGIRELGLVLSRVRLRISSDTWLLRDARAAQAELSVLLP
ncbi:MAG: hypothetical protein ACP5R5_14920, partial [Armatimonadota bacterium]